MDAEAYHVARREERRWVIEAIESVFPQKNFSMCSLGSGFGGEESLLLGGHVALTLVEPDERQYQFLRRKFPYHVSIIKSFFQFCRLPGQVDIVYASSLGNWMNENPLGGINAELRTFLGTHLRPDGLGVFLLYGGTHSAFILDKAAFVRRIIETANESGYSVRLYGRYRPNAALLLISAGTRDVSAFDRHISESELFVRDDKILKAVRASLFGYVGTIPVATNILLKNLRQSMGDFIASFAAVSRYRRD